MTFLNHLAVILIIAYQKTLSPDHGWLKYRHPYGFCHFYPSCSEYAKQAFRQKNFFSALVLSIIRISQCNPWSKPKIHKLNYD